MDNLFAAGDRFLLSQARLLERRLFATIFLGQSGTHVIDALRGYQNDDGGFGHALEPDKRCPASLPIDVETAFQAMAAQCRPPSTSSSSSRAPFTGPTGPTCPR